MPIPSLPVEIQIHILKDAIQNMLASDSTCRHSEAGLSESPAVNFPLATAFVAARTNAPDAPPTKQLALPGTEPLLAQRIQDIADPFLLRVALAAAVPSWCNALRGIPALWSRITVPVDEESWGPAVLDAVREAGDCSQNEYLRIVLTRSPIQHLEDNGGDAERARVGQVMELLMPHILRWRYLRIHTLHAEALPVPTIDFAGFALILRELHLTSVLSAPALSARVLQEDQKPRLLSMPHLEVLTMDADAFNVAFVNNPRALRAVGTLTLWGPGANNGNVSNQGVNDHGGWASLEGTDEIGPPAMSVYQMLLCAVRMRKLHTLCLDGTYPRVQDVWVSDMDNIPEEDAELRNLRRVTHLRCERLSAPVVLEVLRLASYGICSQCKLEIVDCSLPDSGWRGYWENIQLVRIGANEDIDSFLSCMPGCISLTVVDCPGFMVEMFLQTEDEALPWLARHLTVLRMSRCPGVNVQTVQDVIYDRALAATRRNRRRINRLAEVQLEGEYIHV